MFYSWTCDVLSLRDKCIKVDHPCVVGSFGWAFVLSDFTIVTARLNQELQDFRDLMSNSDNEE